jgi:caffeoyl-CoA O-methyltransferase
LLPNRLSILPQRQVLFIMNEAANGNSGAQEQYIETLFPSDPHLAHVKETLRQLGIHDISVAAGYGRLLTFLARTAGAKAALEIGALGGYSGICIAKGLPTDGKLVSLELNPDYAQLAHSNMKHAGYGDMVEYRTGEALHRLQELKAEGRRFDFFFIDADKGNYPAYLELAVELANPGALIAGDNIFLRGKTLSPASLGHSATQVRLFNERIAHDPRLESAILPAYDGLALARVKG